MFVWKTKNESLIFLVMFSTYDHIYGHDYGWSPDYDFFWKYWEEILFFIYTHFICRINFIYLEAYAQERQVIVTGHKRFRGIFKYYGILHYRKVFIKNYMHILILFFQLSVIPSFLGLSSLLRRSGDLRQFFSGCVYGAALVALFLVSTVFHLVFYFSSRRCRWDF